MPFTIEIDDRDWDVDNLLNCLKLPTQREYVAHITVDRPEDAAVIFEGDVQLQRLASLQLTVCEWSEDDGPTSIVRTFDVADIRRISFY